MERPPPKKTKILFCAWKTSPLSSAPAVSVPAGRGGMPPAPAEIMPPSVFQLQHVQHIPKLKLNDFFLLVLKLVLKKPFLFARLYLWPSLVWAFPCSILRPVGGYPQPCHFSGDIRATVAIFSEFARSSWGVILSRFALGSFVLSRLCHGFTVIFSLFARCSSRPCSS